MMRYLVNCSVGIGSAISSIDDVRGDALHASSILSAPKLGGQLLHVLTLRRQIGHAAGSAADSGTESLDFGLPCRIYE